jgi:glycosyltransferase involved in cell wall biosynthesis
VTVEGADAARLRVGVLISVHLGRVTLLDNLRRALESDPRLEPVWMTVPPSARDLWERVRQPQVRASLRARGVLRRHRGEYDVLLIAAPVLFSARQIRRTPSVFSSDATPLAFNQVAEGYGSHAPSGMVERLKTRLTRAVFSASAALVFQSRWAARSAVEDYGTPAEKVRALHPGVDLGLWIPGPRRSQEGPIRLLFVGGDFARKGGQLLLDAMREEALAGLELDIVSPDPAAEPVHASHRIRVHRDLGSNAEELRRLYRECDVFVLPSRGDINPWVILEAMASGLPVVSTRVGAIPEQVEDGVTGLLVAPGDRAALVEALIALAADPELRRSMGAAGRAKVEAEFDAARNTRELFAVLERAAGLGSWAAGAPGVVPTHS